MDSKLVSSNEVIGEVIRLLDTNPSVVLPVEGISMLPFIIGGREKVELVKTDSIRLGDIVLAWVDGRRYVIHRVIGIDGDDIVLMGDGNLWGKEHCKRCNVAARADYVIGKNGRRRYLYTHSQRLGSQLWLKLRPLRRIILAVYKRTIMKIN